MTDIVKKWLGDRYDSLYNRVNTVVDIIRDYFGEDLVDAKLDDRDILLHDLFYDKPLFSMVAVTERTDDFILLMGKIDAIDKEKWEEDKNKLILDLQDKYYFDAILRKVVMMLTQHLENNPIEVLIRFPKVTVTNEYDKSINITELYTRIFITHDGRMLDRFQMMRSEYTVAQYICNYAHSHLPGAYLEWMNPCLGSGPIGNTQAHLMRNYDENLWGLFCYELSKYVTVESISGVPYIRLESVGARHNGYIESFPMSGASLSYHRSHIIDNFIRYFAKTQPFNIAFSYGKYTLGEDAVDFLIRVSRCFTEWYNRKHKSGIYSYCLEDLLSNGILGKYKIVGKTLYRTDGNGSRITDIPILQGRELFTFKDRIVTLNFIETEGMEEGNTLILLNSRIVSAIIVCFLRTINYVYKNQSEENRTEDSEVTTAKKFWFL